MSFFWTHLVGFFIFFIVIFFITLSNIFALKPLKRSYILTSSPSVSVLIPARNEEENIGSCVTSLLDQNYADFQVIVLNDNSTDNTEKILADLVAKNDRLQVINGRPLPEGWTGKNWACFQLVHAVKSELILFVDADTVHHPNTISSAVSTLIRYNTDFLTVIPKQIVRTWGEKLVVPILNWSIFSIMPFAIAHRVQSPKLIMAIGQFMLFKRKAYIESGGHERIANEFLDDFPLAKQLVRHGFKWRMVIGTNHISCRMYHNFHEVYHGLSRSLFTAFGRNTILFVWAWFCIGLVFIEPIIILILYISGYYIEPLTLNAEILMLILAFIMWGIIYARFGYPLYLTFFFPITAILSIIIAMRSLYITKTGRLSWKGRNINQSSAEEQNS